MDPNNNPNDRLSLDLSLGISPRGKDPVDEQHGTFMQLLRSGSDPAQTSQTYPPPHHTVPPRYYNHTYPDQNASVSGLADVPSPPLGVALPPSPSPYLGGQLLQPCMMNQGGAGALETPRPGTRLGRPPNAHHARRSSLKASATVEKKLDDKDIVPPYPWATTKPARIHSLRYLYLNNINVIYGQVHCKPCEITQTIEYNLSEKFGELYRYVYDNKDEMRHRAQKVWSCPKLTPCGSCKNGMKPVIGENKEEINWLFLLLGQMLGCCTLDQLRYFCDRTSQHRTGAKDRVLYITYLGLCKQLEPCDLFNL